MKDGKKQIYPFFLVLITVSIFVSMFILNDVVRYIRILELRSFISDINRSVAQVDYLNMITKFKLHKDLFKDKIREGDLDKEEMKVNLLISSFEDQKEISFEKYQSVTPLILGLINAMRGIFRKPPIKLSFEKSQDDQIAVAYYYERNKKYGKALAVYKTLLEANSAENEKNPVIILHQGFCYAVQGDYENAKAKFLKIITGYNNEDVSITAAILLGYLEEFRKEVEKIKLSDENSIQKSEKLFKLIAYNEALDILDEIEAS